MPYMSNICEDCVCYDYDQELEAFVCTMDLDEDEMERLQTVRGKYDGTGGSVR